MKPILEVKNISKKYRISHLSGGYLSLRERIVNGLFSNNFKKEDFLALNDVSFDVLPGESIGIIGRNGAGKSTLLKILSKITPPTKGRIIARGRIASLLEVGTGFHPELSGRENIFFNGSLLGMKRKEIENKFDEIVEFSGTEKFLDTALKHYSSGMQLRLAFAVAAFLESEILVIDEVLAVGDFEFQKKCFQKMEAVTKTEGRTILFVSHNLNFVLNLCNKSILLNEGRILDFGRTQDIVVKYLDDSTSEKKFVREIDIQKKIQLIKAAIAEEDYDQITIQLIINAIKRDVCSIDLRISDTLNNPVGFASIGGLDFDEMLNLSPGLNSFKITLVTSALAIGEYLIHFDITRPNIEYFDRVFNGLRFEVIKKASKENKRFLLQQWNYGCYHIPIKLV